MVEQLKELFNFLGQFKAAVASSSSRTVIDSLRSGSDWIETYLGNGFIYILRGVGNFLVLIFEGIANFIKWLLLFLPS